MKVYISLTSIKGNQWALIRTLKSLVVQTRKPDHCFLYLSDHPYLLDKGFKGKDINHGGVSEFIEENSDWITLKWVDNTGPYRKLVPLMTDCWGEDVCIITVDDDTVYSDNLVKNMLEDYAQHGCCVGNRSFTFNLKGRGFDRLSYGSRVVRSKQSLRSLHNFHTGKGGVLYRPDFFSSTESLFFDSSKFTTVCKSGDDIWFNYLRMANGVDCVMGKSRHSYSVADNTTYLGLWKNINRKAPKGECVNTQQMRATALLLQSEGLDLVRRPSKKTE